MRRARINPRYVKLHHCYSVEEIATRFGVHKNTVRGWQRDGLAPIDKSRPMLFLGRVLRAYLESKRSKAKRPCPPGTLYCFRCRVPQAPALGMVDYTPRNAATGTLSALCGTCSTLMHQRASLASLPLKMPKIDVQIQQGELRIS